MQRITDLTAAVAPDVVAESGVPGYWTAGDPGTGVLATRLTGAWLQRVDDELCGCVTILRGGSGLSALDSNQIADLLAHADCLTSYPDGTPCGAVGAGILTPNPKALVANEGACYIEDVDGAAIIAGSYLCGIKDATSGDVRAAILASEASICQGQCQAIIASIGVTMPDDGVQQFCAASGTVSGMGDRTAVLASHVITDVGANYAAVIGSTDSSIDSDTTYGLVAASSSVDIVNSAFAAIIASSDDSQIHDNAKSAIIASVTGFTDGTAGGSNAVIASNFGQAYGACSLVAATYSVDVGHKCVASGDFSAILASKTDCYSVGNLSLVAASNECRANNAICATLFSEVCRVDTGGGTLAASYSALMASVNAELAATYCIGGGIDVSEPTWSHTDQNLTWRIDTVGGTGNFEGGTSTTPIDYAEMFELDASQNAQPIEAGCLIGLVGDKVRTARVDDHVLGVLSVRPGVLGGDGVGYQGRYQTDEWGRVLWADQTMPDGKILHLPLNDPKYNPAQVWVPRKDRPTEWAAVALLGQVRARIGGGVAVGDCLTVGSVAGLGIACEDGDTSKIRVMKIEAAFDSGRGFGIALVLVG